MNLDTIYTMSRLNTGTDSTNMPDATLLTITNVTYRDLINIITTEVNEDFFYQEWTGLTVIGQTEYTFPVRTSLVAWLKKLEAVSIKYLSTDTDYTSATPSKITNLTRDKAWYNDNISTATPIFIVADKSVFIYPAPTEVNNFILYGVSDPIELQASATEAQILIPVDFHHIIVLGNEYRIHKANVKTNEKNDSLNEYKNEIRKMVTQLSDRINKPLVSEMPNLNSLE